MIVTMSAREVELSGGAPWGFRMHGGADQNQPLRISRVSCVYISHMSLRNHIYFTLNLEFYFDFWITFDYYTYNMYLSIFYSLCIFSHFIYVIISVTYVTLRVTYIELLFRKLLKSVNTISFGNFSWYMRRKKYFLLIYVCDYLYKLGYISKKRRKKITFSEISWFQTL